MLYKKSQYGVLLYDEKRAQYTCMFLDGMIRV